MLTKMCITTCLLLCAVAPASAGQPGLRINYGDLDLSRPAGRATLQDRIDRAVSEACGRADVADLGAESEVRHCRRQLLAGLSPRRDALIAASTPHPSNRLAAELR